MSWTWRPPKLMDPDAGIVVLRWATDPERPDTILVSTNSPAATTTAPADPPWSWSSMAPPGGHAMTHASAVLDVAISAHRRRAGRAIPGHDAARVASRVAIATSSSGSGSLPSSLPERWGARYCQGMATSRDHSASSPGGNATRGFGAIAMPRL